MSLHQVRRITTKLVQISETTEQINFFNRLTDQNSEEYLSIMTDPVVEIENNSEVDYDSKLKLKNKRIVERFGYRWGTESKYWILWTIWEPRLLETLYPISQLRYNDACLWKPQDFVHCMNAAASSFMLDESFKPLKIYFDEIVRFAVVRLDFQEEFESYLPLSGMVEIRGSEVIFNNGTITLRFRPIYVIACAGLAEILRAVCRKSDTLIFSGTCKRTFDTQGKNYILLNFDNEQGQVQIIRVTFPKEVKEIKEMYMIEKITPTQRDKRYIFKYFAHEANGKSRKQVTRHADFKWRNNADNIVDSWYNESIEFWEFPVPVQYEQDEFEAYSEILFKNSTNYFLNSLSNSSSLPNRSNSIHTEETSFSRSEESTLNATKDPIVIISTSKELEKDSPVFFTANRKNRIRNKGQSKVKQIPVQTAPTDDTSSISWRKFNQNLRNILDIILRLLVLAILWFILLAVVNVFVHSLLCDGSTNSCSTFDYTSQKSMHLGAEKVVSEEDETNFISRVKSLWDSAIKWLVENCGLKCMADIIVKKIKNFV